ncbi:hypothetical protein WJX73_002691 [Symbiochloris irregularis]|uniref:Uncharacterized protein n=1 Tax=Symbiochloris irregularis TaxID=706552 RepID=A0AAW1Q2D7_9CHLO
MAGRIATSFSQASRKPTEIRVLMLARSDDLKCMNLLCSKVGEPCICRLHVVLSKLVNLEEISLAGNALTAVPAALWECAKLRKLDLSDNLLKELPADMSQLQQLEVLDTGPDCASRLRNAVQGFLRWTTGASSVSGAGHQSGLLTLAICKSIPRASAAPVEGLDADQLAPVNRRRKRNGNATHDWAVVRAARQTRGKVSKGDGEKKTSWTCQLELLECNSISANESHTECSGSPGLHAFPTDPETRFQIGVKKTSRRSLMEFGGIGKVRSDRILRELAVRGPYRDSSEMQLRVFGIGPALADDLWAADAFWRMSAMIYIVIYVHQ